MIVNSKLLNELFRAFHIQRWNDRLRPMELIEMDKHALKMILAYCFGRLEEHAGRQVDWHEIIRGGIYEMMRRIVISDIKSPIFSEIKKHSTVYEKLNRYVFKELSAMVTDDGIRDEIEEFLFARPAENTLSRRVLDAAHLYSSYREFEIIRIANPLGYQNVKIESELLNNIQQYNDIEGIRKLVTRQSISNFVDLCHQLRFQVRWAQTPRVPKTSVLGHSMLVASISYFFIRELSPTPKRIYNAFFGGLYHDLPEAVTRDIISPVKNSSAELDSLIKALERTLADEEIFPHVEPFMVDELKYFAQEEFSNKIIVNGEVRCGLEFADLHENYNEDGFSPYDGQIIRASDHLSTFLEAWHSCDSGIRSDELRNSYKKIRESYEGRCFGPINLSDVYSGFEDHD